MQPMEKTSVFMTHHWHTWFTFTIYLDRNPIGLQNVHHEALKVHVRHIIIYHDKIQFLTKNVFELHHLRISCYNTQWSISYNTYTRHTRMVQFFKYWTWSNITRVFSIYPTACISLTRTTPVLQKHVDILKTNTLPLNCPKILLPKLYLNLEWCLSTMILSIVFIPPQTNFLKPNTKLQQFGEAKIFIHELNVSMTTSKDKHAR